jgi:hypothetical protein
MQDLDTALSYRGLSSSDWLLCLYHSQHHSPLLQFQFHYELLLHINIKLEFILNYSCFIPALKSPQCYVHKAMMFFHMCLIFYNCPVCNRLLRQCAQFMLGRFSTFLWLLIVYGRTVVANLESCCWPDKSTVFISFGIQWSGSVILMN